MTSHPPNSSNMMNKSYKPVMENNKSYEFQNI